MHPEYTWRCGSIQAVMIGPYQQRRVFSRRQVIQATSNLNDVCLSERVFVNMPSVTINGEMVQTVEGQSILEAARGVGITIPTLCYHPDLSVAGSCRLCLVDVEGHSGHVPACSQPVSEGMVIQTESADVVAARRFVLELLLQRYVDRGDTSGDRDSTEFLRWV